jgi:hypothetical protein
MKIGVYHAAQWRFRRRFAFGARLSRCRLCLPNRGFDALIDANLCTLCEQAKKGYSQSIRNYGN